MEYIEVLKSNIERAEGMLCGLVLKNPDVLLDYNINKMLLSENALFYIGLTNKLLEKGTNVIDEISFKNEVDLIGLTDKYETLGGWRTVKELMEIIDIRNSDSIIDNFNKWNIIKLYNDYGILNLEKHWNKLIMMTAIQIEDYMTALISDIGLKNNINGALEVQDLTTGYEEAIEEWDKGLEVGYKLGFPILNYTLCGLHKGTLNFLLAHSGNGKTSFAIPCTILPIIESGEKMLILANEQQCNEWRQMILSTVLFNKIKYTKMNRQKLIYGGFTYEDKEALKKAYEWLGQFKGNLKFVHLKDYGIENIRKIIKKYSKMGFGVMLLDTLKPEDDASEKAWGQFSETAKELFVLAQQCNIALMCTAQLATNSYGRKYLDLNCIGKSRAIAEVASQVIMFRSMTDKEKENIKVVRNKKDANGKLTNKKEEVEINKDKDYIILFIAKNRYGEGNKQLVYERNMSFNQYYELGETHIEYDGFGK